MSEISAATLNKWLSYDPDEGTLTWIKKRHGRGSVVGGEAGTVSVRGYKIVTLFGKKLPVHRVAWKMFYGNCADGLCIDHIDGDKLNNRISNLRQVTLSENQRNSRIPITNKTGEMGVSLHKSGFYSVSVAGKYFGIRKDFEAAIELRDRAFSEMSCHPNHGRAM